MSPFCPCLCLSTCNTLLAGCFAETRFLSSQFQHAQPPSTAANLASLRRIRALVTSADPKNGGVNGEGSLREEGGSRLGEGDAGRRSSAPDAATVFRGVRVLLEQNICGILGAEEVRQNVQIKSWSSCQGPEKRQNYKLHFPAFRR